MIPITNYKKGLNALCASAFAGAALAGSSVGYSQDDDVEEEVFELSPFTVDGSRDNGYYSNETLAGGRMNSKLSDLATSVQAITSDFLNDVGANSLDEVLIYTTGTDAIGSGSDYLGVTEGTSGSLGSGETRTNPSSITNVRALGHATRTVDYYQSEIPFDSYISGRVDINRGANSFLFGLGSPAGIVNSTTTQASFTDSTDIRFELSTENFENNESWRTSLNANRVLIEDKLAIRVATLFEEEEYIQRPAGKDTQRNFVAFNYKPFAEKNLNVRANFEKGNIDATPVDRLGPAENLSTFLNDPIGNVWQKTSENPTGRMWVDAFQAIRDDAPNMLGYSEDGTEIPYINNPTGAPVGTGWNLVFDDSVSPEGYPTWAYQTNIAGQYYTGNPYLDPDGDGNGGTRVNSTVAVYGPISYGNILSEYPRYADQGLLDYSLFDFRKNLISGNMDYYGHDFEKENLEIEFLSDSGKYGVVLGYNHQDWENNNFIGAGRPRITLDVNETLPVDGSVNPNFGRVYIYTSTPEKRIETIERESFRATAFAKFDFEERFDNGPLRWLGRHTATAMLDENEMDRKRLGWVMGSYGGDVEFHTDTQTDAIGNSRRTKAFIYLGEANMEAWTNPDFQLSDFDIGRVPSHYNLTHLPDGYETTVRYWNVGDPAVEASRDDLTGGQEILDDNGDVIGTVEHEHPDTTRYTTPFIPQSGQLENRDASSRAINLQSFFLDEHFVANLGYREDEVYRLWNTSVPKSEDGSAIHDPAVFNFDNTEKELMTAENFAYGLVLKVPQRWTPEGTSVSFHYGESDNFEPSPAGYNHYGELLNSSSGSSRDIGVTVNVGSRFNARINYYEGSVSDAYYGPVVGGYRVATSQTMLNWYRNSWDEMETYDANRDYVFDDITRDDGVDNSGNPQGIANNGKDDRTEHIYGTENVISLEQMHQIEIVGQEFVTPWVLETTKPVLNTREDNNGGNPSTSAGPELYSVLTDTADLAAKGWELEMTYNVSDSLRLSFNASKQSTVRSNLAPNTTKYFEEYLAIFDEHPWMANVRNFGRLTTPIYEDKWHPQAIWGRYISNQYGGQNYFFNKALEGTEDPSARKYRANLVANYSFRDGRFKGVGIGGAYRYQSKAAIGYGSTVDENTGTVYPDPTQPYYDEGREYFDLWVSYGKKVFNDKVRWKVQLNVRNLFAEKDPIPVQFQPDASVASTMYPSPREIMLRNSFSF
ncbi:hypothetical protein [Pelagicoccus sp. SDUM812005]|uniref:hypothetical protein n=1 Tax=Pelagicoccus sp. SDUM812005 TaxID=3041257 RepID=UPI00280CB287|nr:hypothetical protein [Pelagicoccus sp. SDUM812005]MDQ8183318.1 hypothetical protein [Pelagicoccus sp. SDUM812005]